MSKPVYTAISFTEFISALLYRIAALCFMVYLGLHFTENPVLIGILILITIVFFIEIGDDQIIIYEDRIVQKHNALLPIFSKPKSIRFEIQEIESAYLEKKESTSSTTEVGVAFAIAALLPKLQRNRSKSNPIYFKLKSGATVSFDTDLGLSDREKIVTIINALLKV
jgi:hypothetical protein